MSEEKYVPQGAYLVCNKGAAITQLIVTNNQMCSIYGEGTATELDKVPLVNIMPFGVCSINNKDCVPVPIEWSPIQNDVEIGGGALINEESKLSCSVGGEVEIHFSKASAEAALPPPSKGWKDHVTGAFDWVEEKLDEGSDLTRDLLGVEEGSLMDSILSVPETYVDFQFGVAEGFIKGAGDTLEFVADVGVWTFNRSPPMAFFRMEQNAQEDWDMIKDLAGGGKNLLVWSYRSSALNLALNPTDWHEQQLANAAMAEMAMNHIGNMDARDWGNVGGYLAFEVAMEVATSGAGSARHINKVDNVADGARLLNQGGNITDLARGVENIDDFTDGTRAIEEAQNLGSVTNQVDELSNRPPRKPSDKNPNIDHSRTTNNPDGSTTYYDHDGNAVTYNSDGYPDFSPYSEAEFEIPNMDGTSSDFSKVYEKMKEEYGFNTQKEVRDWLKEQGLTPHHHQNGVTIQLVDTKIHNKFPHSGGASNLRNGN